MHIVDRPNLNVYTRLVDRVRRTTATSFSLVGADLDPVTVSHILDALVSPTSTVLHCDLSSNRVDWRNMRALRRLLRGSNLVTLALADCKMLSSDQVETILSEVRRPTLKRLTIWADNECFDPVDLGPDVERARSSGLAVIVDR